jgi:hypothetical protein
MHRTRNCTCLDIMNDPSRHFKECPERAIHPVLDARKVVARQMAETALRDIANADLIYAHHGGINSRGDKAYERLAAYFIAFAAGKDAL